MSVETLGFLFGVSVQTLTFGFLGGLLYQNVKDLKDITKDHEERIRGLE